ncbi:arylamine N-acetyltransferase family protein [Bacillus nitroreducens]
MSELNTLFRKRIGIPEHEKLTFESLDDILEKTANTIPFENLCIIEKRTNDINKENLTKKILVKHEGGLCYELNTLLYYFLVDNGFNVVMTRGITYNHMNQEFSRAGRTHVTILATHEERTYLVDTGFGGNLPLKPVPLTGETVTSNNGEFRIKKVNTEHGDYILEIKLRHKDADFKTGFAFDSKQIVSDMSEVNDVQKIIVEHEGSPFNKHPLVTRLTPKGNVTLTDTSFTQWIDGIVTKEEIDKTRFQELLEEHFGK